MPIAANKFVLQVGIALHWAWVFAQLYFLPTNTLRLLFFAISQLGGGFLIAMVVTYNHNSVDKYPGNRGNRSILSWV